MITPCRMPRVTASVRLDALSLVKIEPRWNLTVCSEMPRRQAMALFPKPSASMFSTSISQGVKACCEAAGNSRGAGDSMGSRDSSVSRWSATNPTAAASMAARISRATAWRGKIA